MNYIPEFEYNKLTGASLYNSPIFDWSNVEKTHLLFPYVREIGLWPFYNQRTNSWEIRSNQKVTPVFNVVLIFHPKLKYNERVYLLPSNSSEYDVTNYGSNLLSSINSICSDASIVLNFATAIATLNNALEEVYSDHERYFEKLRSTHFCFPIETQKLQNNAFGLFAKFRSLLRIILPHYLSHHGICMKDERLPDDAMQLPTIQKYLLLFHLIQDVDNAFKHDKLTWRINLDNLETPGYKLRKLNKCTHHKKIWKLCDIASPHMDYSRKQFWEYSVHYNALAALFSDFLNDILSLGENSQAAPAKVYFQITQNVTLAENLPIDPKQNK